MVPKSSAPERANTENLEVIRSLTGRSTHVKSPVGTWPACRYDAQYGNRITVFVPAEGDVTCRRCRHAYGLLVPGERPVTGG